MELCIISVRFQVIIQQILRNARNTTVVHGRIETYDAFMANSEQKFCRNYIMLAGDVELALNAIGFQLYSKVLLVTSMSRWQVREFLQSSSSRRVQNLLVIADPTLQREDFSFHLKSNDINLYTHSLHTDGIGSSDAKILTAWRRNAFTRPDVNLFPPKLRKGFNGHRLIVSAFEQPPFVFRSKKSYVNTDDFEAWEGLEIRLLRMIATYVNMTLSIRDSTTGNEVSLKDGAEEVIQDVNKGVADIGVSGIYITRRFYNMVHFSAPHVQDCATFITLSSTAIPKYRAILGPFQWTVWVSIICIYLASVIPINFLDRMSCKKMFKNSAEVGYMFWTVFGVYTNCFTFKQKDLWSNTKKDSTRIVVGTYWMLTIILVATYSSSIISFITIPNYFDVVDSVKDLLDDDYRVGTLGQREWSVWFNDSSDYRTNKLLKKLDVVTDVGVGLHKVKKWDNYAFLGSKALLSYIVRSNYTPSESKKKSMFHITSQCLAPFMVSIAMKRNSDYMDRFNSLLMKMQENGLVNKFLRDVEYDVIRSSSGKALAAVKSSIRAAAPEDRQLTLDDMQGMFLLLGIGVSMAFTSLVHECWAGYTCCDQVRSFRTPSGSRRPSTQDMGNPPSIVLTKSLEDRQTFGEKLYKRAVSATSHFIDDNLLHRKPSGLRPTSS